MSSPTTSSSPKGMELVVASMNASERAARGEDAGKVVMKRRKATQKAVEEETFTSALEHIISRDYFPAAHTSKKVKLKDHIGDDDDNASVWSTSALDGLRAHGASSSSDEEESDGEEKEVDPEEVSKLVETPTGKPVSLSSFTSKYSSEDDSEFVQALNRDAEKRRKQYWWAQQEHVETNPTFRLTEKGEERRSFPDSWKFTAKNALMYGPSTEEIVQNTKGNEFAKPKAIVARNTRFPPSYTATRDSLSKVGMETPPSPSTSSVSSRSSVVSSLSRGGRAPTPSVGGYKLLRTPTPVAGKDVDPVMTWGNIVGTPVALPEESLSSTPSPRFKVPKTPQRDLLALKLAADMRNKTLKKQAKKKKDRTPSRSPATPTGHLTPAHRLSQMSPAAVRLMKMRSSTPLGTPTRPNPTSSSSSSSSSSKLNRSQRPSLSRPATPVRPKPKTPIPLHRSSSLTDDLL